MNRLFKQSEIASLVAIGIGAALFFVLGRFVSIPIPFIPNTSFSLQYGILAVFALLYGPLCAFFAGLIGHILIDVTGYGLWISWELTSAIVGLLIGVICFKIAAHRGDFGKQGLLKFNVSIIIANVIGWALVAPVLDIVVYSEPANKVFLQGIVAALSNSLTACIIGSILAIAYVKSRPQKGALDTE